MRRKTSKSHLGLMLTLALLSGVAPPARGHGAEVRNGRILISDNYAWVASMRPDGSGFRVLVEHSDDPGNGRWSPDKTQFAYTQISKGGTFDLYVKSAYGRDRKLVTTSDDVRFSWSPDSRYLAYVDVTESSSLIDGTCYGIWVVNVRTLATRVVIDGPDCRAHDPQWSPSGNEIAFVNGQDPVTVDPDLDIYKVDVTTGELTQLTDTAALDHAPEWSPSGSSIVFASSRDHESAKWVGGCMRRTEIYRMRSDGSRQVRLTGKLHRPDCRPSWSPDGRRIAWMTSLRRKPGDEQRPIEVRVMRSDGTGTIRVTNGRRLPSHGADFSPDGRWIVFIVYHRGERPYFDLYKSRVDGSRRVRLTRRGVHSGFPDW